jgi:hypothetical protein
MRIDNLNFHPIRLRMERFANGQYKIYRDDQMVGELHHQRDGWQVYSRWTQSRTTSFRVAALQVARLRCPIIRVQDHGVAPVLRVQVNTVWYTVVQHPHGSWIYEDFTIPKTLTDDQQAQLKAALVAAKKT